MDITDVKYIIECAQQGNELPFNTFFEYVFQKLSPRLRSLTKSTEDSQEVFIISMQKFWERFVINQENLPHNSIGYIFIMCKNAWLMQKRSRANIIATVKNPIEHQHLLQEDAQFDVLEEDKPVEDLELLKHRALIIALASISEKCRLLMENEFDKNRQLKDLQEELGYTNYQALVQAKYNCKKRLIQKVYKAMENIQNNSKATF